MTRSPTKLAAMLLLVALSPPARSAEPADKKFENARFTVAYPPRWGVVQNPPAPLLLLLTPGARASRDGPTIYVSAERGKSTLDQLEEKTVADLKQTSPDAQVLSSDDAKLGGERARKVVIKGRDRLGGPERQSAMVLCVHGDFAYAVGCTAAADDFDRNGADLDKVAASFRFSDGASKGKGKDDKPKDEKPKEGEKLPF